MAHKIGGRMMFKLATGVAIIASTATLATLANAQTARLEVLPITSVTVSDSDLLAGRKVGQQVIIAGELRLPKPGNDKLPAVILLHGSGGIGGTGGSVDEWSRQLNQLGIATFALDSFAGRGIVSTVADQAQLGRLNMVVDSYRALETLAKHPRIDASRIAVMGFSRGGQSALYSAMTRLFEAASSGNNMQFAAHIAFYPDCTTTYRQDTSVTGKPIRILHGTADDYNPIAPCRSYVDRLLKANKDVRLIEYPDTYHVFDSPILRKPLKLAAATTTRYCRLAEADDGQIIDQETRKPFAYSDACVDKGPTIAFNESASNQAHAFIGEFLTEVFQLK